MCCFKEVQLSTILLSLLYGIHLKWMLINKRLGDIEGDAREAEGVVGKVGVVGEEGEGEDGTPSLF